MEEILDMFYDAEGDDINFQLMEVLTAKQLRTLMTNEPKMIALAVIYAKQMIHGTFREDFDLDNEVEFQQYGIKELTTYMNKLIEKKQVKVTIKYQ